jgi:GTPase Era involved in 16S rRNA processing
MKPQKINIAVSGNTNVGKTTLIRTLMKASIGEVRDAANVTTTCQSYQFDSLQAIFTDTPGFQNPSDTEEYFYELDEDPTYKLSQRRQDKLIFDLEAIKALDGIDAVIYVVSLAAVPDDSFSSEISLIKRKCSKIVAVINQYQQQCKATNEVACKNRIEQWKALFEKHSIDTVVIFDTHWDNPIKVDKIYSGLQVSKVQ